MPPRKSAYAWNDDQDENLLAEVLKDVKTEQENKREKAQNYEDKMKQAKAASILKALDVDPDTFTGWRLSAHKAMSGLTFDLAVGLVISLNALTIGLETQIKSTVPLGCSSSCDDCSRQVDPSAECETVPDWIEVVEMIFFVFYSTEFLLRLLVYGPCVIRSNMVKFDAFLVVSAGVDMVLKYTTEKSPVGQIMLIRLLRLGRLARALRLLVQFQTLWQLVQGLFHSLGTLVWMFVLLGCLIYISAIAGLELISVNPDLPLDHPYNQVVDENFGSFLKAVFTNLQLFSFDSIGSIYRPVIRENMLSFFYFIGVILLLSIALMNLVTAIMVNSSLEQAGEDKEARKAWEAARKAKQMDQLKEMFLELDEDGSGELTLDEIRSAPEAVQENLEEIAGTDDLTELFQLLDYDGGGTVGVEEFCDGVLKTTEGQPGALELSRLVKQCTDILNSTRGAEQILNDPSKKFVELAKNGGTTLPGGGSGPTPKQMSKVNAKVDKVEKMLWKCNSDIGRLLQNINDRAAASMSKSIPSNTMGMTRTAQGQSKRRTPGVAQAFRSTR